MNVSPINTTQPNFNAKIIKKGHWSKELSDTFDNNLEIQKLIQGDKDIIAKVSKSFSFDIYNGYTEIFKLKLISISENPTFMDKIKLFLGLLPQKNISKHYHRSFRIDDLINKRINAQKYAEELKINI